AILTQCMWKRICCIMACLTCQGLPLKQAL
ncbi:alanine dehydrogenase, partial [Helicobacter pylori]